MYPLPPELEQKIWQAIAAGIDTDGDPAKDIFNAFAALFVRENRRLRQQVCDLWRDLSEAASRDDVDYGAVMAAGGGEFTCEHIVNEILKRNVYFNTKDAADRAEAVERLIESLDEADDGPALSD